MLLSVLSRERTLLNSRMRCWVLGAIVQHGGHILCFFFWSAMLPKASAFHEAWCNSLELQNNPDEIMLLPWGLSCSEEWERRDRGGEGSLSSTFHRIRPLEIRWCQNLCIYHQALKRSFTVQARMMLALASLCANWNLCVCVSAQHSKMESCSGNRNTLMLLKSK